MNVPPACLSLWRASATTACLSPRGSSSSATGTSPAFPATRIVSRALNQRLLVDAIADAAGVALSVPEPLQSDPTPQTALFDGILESLKTDVAALASDSRAVAAAKTNAKVVKYLREVDRLGALVAQDELCSLRRLLGRPGIGAAEGHAELLKRLHPQTLAFPAVLQFFADVAARQAQLAAMSSGGLATRRLPSLESLGPTTNRTTRRLADHWLATTASTLPT